MWAFLGESLSPLLSFARASSKNVFSTSGDLANVATNLPAFDHVPVTGSVRGLLIEPQRTNYLRYNSNPYTNWSLDSCTKAAYGSGLLGFPDPAVIGSSGAVWHKLRISTASVTSGTTYGWKVLVKAGTSGKVLVTLRNPSAQYTSLAGNLGATLSLTEMSAGTATCTQTVTLGNNIFEITGTWIPNQSGVCQVGVGPNSTVSGETVVLIAGQLEDGTTSTSYIQTTTDSVTRAADILSFTVPSAVTRLRYVFDDDSTQDVDVVAGSYTVPANLNRAWIKRLYSI